MVGVSLIPPPQRIGCWWLYTHSGCCPLGQVGDRPQPLPILACRWRTGVRKVLSVGLKGYN